MNKLQLRPKSLHFELFTNTKLSRNCSYSHKHLFSNTLLSVAPFLQMIIQAVLIKIFIKRGGNYVRRK